MLELEVDYDYLLLLLLLLSPLLLLYYESTPTGNNDEEQYNFYVFILNVPIVILLPLTTIY